MGAKAKRWIPFMGSVVTVAAIILKAFPSTAAYGDSILGVLTLLPGIETLDQAQVTAAVTSGVGLGLQLWSRYQKASKGF